MNIFREFKIVSNNGLNEIKFGDHLFNHLEIIINNDFLLTFFYKVKNNKKL